MLTMQTRRSFLAGAALAARGYRPELGAQVYVWTQHVAQQKRQLPDTLEEMVATFRRAGFRRLELMAGLLQGRSREDLVRLGRKYRVAFPVVYDGRPIDEPEAAEKSLVHVLDNARLAKSIGARALNFNPSPRPGGAAKTDQQLETQARCLNRLGEALQRDGLRLFVHQHAPEMQQEAREWRHQLHNTDPKLVGIGLDVDWVFRGGQDPLTLLREARDRLGSLHLRSSRNRVWTETFGDGDIDYPAVAAYLRQIDYRGYLFVELAYEKATQVTRSLEDNLRLSRHYAERTFAVKAQ